MSQHVNLRTWVSEINRRALLDEHPFDGRRAKHLLAFAHDVGWSSKWKTGTAATLTAVRARYGARMTRRYVEVLVGAELLMQTRRPARVRDGVGRGRAAEYALTVPDVVSIAAHFPTGKGAAITSTKVGSDNGDDDTDDTLEPRLSLPTGEHESDTPTNSVARTFDVEKLVSLASRSQDWAGWQCVASLVRVA